MQPCRVVDCAKSFSRSKVAALTNFMVTIGVVNTAIPALLATLRSSGLSVFFLEVTIQGMARSQMVLKRNMRSFLSRLLR